MRRFLVGLVLLAACSGSASAQDTHYWTQKYGTRSLLLGGAVIGSVVDLSATYYNPGGLALLDPGLILTAKAFEYTSLTFENGAGPGIDLETSRTGLVPTVVAGKLPNILPERHSLSYSFLQRYVLATEVAGRLITPGGGTTDEEFSELLLDIDLDESWTGISWAYRLTDRVGIGISQFLAIRSQTGSKRVLDQSLSPAGATQAGLDFRGFDYTDYRLLWKAGIAMHRDKLTLGANFTTPSVHIAGSGEAGINQLDTNSGEYAVSTQESSSNYQSSIAAGAGLSYKLPRVTLHGSVEWFDAIEPYEVLDTTPIVAQGSGTTVPLPVTQNLESVVNWGVGVEYTLKPGLIGFASFATDYSANFPGSQSTTSTSNWDIYQLSVGSSFMVGKSEFTLGFGYGFGDNSRQPLADLSGAVDKGTLNYNSLRFIFGFSI